MSPSYFLLLCHQNVLIDCSAFFSRNLSGGLRMVDMGRIEAHNAASALVNAQLLGKKDHIDHIGTVFNYENVP
jgi:hypothetical protein